MNGDIPEVKAEFTTPGNVTLTLEGGTCNSLRKYLLGSTARWVKSLESSLREVEASRYAIENYCRGTLLGLVHIGALYKDPCGDWVFLEEKLLPEHTGGDESYDVTVGDWYCEQCDEYLLPARVTNDERCDTCKSPVEWREYLE